jgi:hypothetical protein
MTGRILRFIGIVLMSLTIAFQILGAVGSSCVALGAEKYASMAPLAPFKWLYQILILLTLAIALYGVKTTVALVKGKTGSFKIALIVLIGVLVLSGIQMVVSEILRGKSAPTNVRVYLTAFTLLVLLLLRLPKIWQKVGFESESTSTGVSAGMALFLPGVMALSVHLWAGSTHTFNGVNYADAWRIPLNLVGWGLVLVGVLIIASQCLKIGIIEGAKDFRELEGYGLK